MHYSTVYVGMDVHKETFSLCCYTNEKEQAEYPQKVDAHYSKVLNYIEAMRFHYGDDVLFICGYEAGCLGFTLYHELTTHNVKCVIMAPTTMAVPKHSKNCHCQRACLLYLGHDDGQRSMKARLLILAWCVLSATFELAPKNALKILPTVTNSKADRKLSATVVVPSIAFFSG